MFSVPSVASGYTLGQPLASASGSGSGSGTSPKSTKSAKSARLSSAPGGAGVGSASPPSSPIRVTRTQNDDDDDQAHPDAFASASEQHGSPSSIFSGQLGLAHLHPHSHPHATDADSSHTTTEAEAEAGTGTAADSSPTKSVADPQRSPKSPRLAATAGLAEQGRNKRHSPRASKGSFSARMESTEEADKRRSRIRADRDRDSSGDYDVEPIPATSRAKAQDKARISPLAKRLGEEPPFMLPHPSKADANSQSYPGVVIGSFAQSGNSPALGFGDGVGFDGSMTMDDIVSSSAAPRSDSRHGSTSATGQAGANIAPWLMDDGPKSPNPAAARSASPAPLSPSRASRVPANVREKETLRKSSMQVLNHFASVPALPKIRRTGTVDTISEARPSSRSGSQPSLPPHGATNNGAASSSSSIRAVSNRSRAGSGDSLQTLSAGHGGVRGGSPGAESVHLPAPTQAPARHGSVARVSRFGSTASRASDMGSSGSERKKGFLGGLLKRKTGPSISFNPDFHPSDGYRGSTATGSASSKASIGSTTSTSPQSPTNVGPAEPSGPLNVSSDSFGRALHRGSNYMSEGAISPLHEIAETPFHLDMNLDDMEGIVDPTKSNVTPSMYPGSAGSGQATSQSGSQASGSMLLQDALHHTSSFATTVSGESSGSGGSGTNQPTGRAVVAEADRQSGPFSRQNPFQTGSSFGSIEAKPFSPPSPHTLSPKHHLPPSTQPRRPSQLRNVKMGSVDSEASDVADGGALQPLAPAWATSPSLNQPTLFNDPFGSSVSLKPPTEEGSPRPGSVPDSEARLSAGTAGAAGLAAPAAVWAAPESWGVEGDEEPQEEDTTSEEEDEEWVAEGTEQASPMKEERSGALSPSPESGAKKPPPFGFKSQTQNGPPKSARGAASRPGTTGQRKIKTSSGRPSTSAKSGTSGRPGTSGSAHTVAPLHWIRIFLVDGSYTVYQLPFSTTTSELISILHKSSDGLNGKKFSTNMKLYIRERGQDRMLLPSEKPLAIQHRRLLQAGFTDADYLEDIGKSDGGILYRFVYSAPALPVMDPEEESSYDSFEFIDIAGRDLQTIPIFLHLHAHNIIILNASRNPMTDLPLDFIQACTSLKELRMSNMALKRVPASIRASSTLARLDISCNRIADLESVPLHEVETLVSLKVQNNKLTSMPAYFAQMKALKYLNISNNNFETFPSVVCEMSNLVDLDVSFNNIVELPSKMSELKSLERLALFSNELTRLPESFSTLANLRILDVRRNVIVDLSVVYALPNLATLQADFNNVVTLDAQLGGNVRKFSVPHNSVTRFTLAPPPNMAVMTYMLTNLDLSHGKIASLTDDSFSGLINLVTLNLNFNQLTKLPSTLHRLQSLEVFSCTDNMLHTLPAGFGRCQRLREINLHNNNLKSLISDLWLCGSLEVLNASSNLLEGFEPLPDNWQEYFSSEDYKLSNAYANAVDKTAIPAIPPAAINAKRVYLGDNRITDEIFHYMAALVGVKVINLSFNDISEIPLGTLGRLDKLEALYLSGNKLSSLPSEDLEKLVSLKTLHLNGNKLQTLPSELGAIKTLQHLDVGSNVLKYNIANWPYDWNWNWNTALRYLNLSGNKRLEIKPTSAQDMSHASSFRKELSDFTALTQLRVLGLMDVTLRIPSLPDESEDKRVRTSFSDINNMAYGISDMLGNLEHLSMFDMVVPNFRGNDNECLFGMFGRAQTSPHSGKIPKLIQGIFADTFAKQLSRLRENEGVGEALRRTFLGANRKTFEHFVDVNTKKRRGSGESNMTVEGTLRGWAPGVGSPMRTGSSGAVVYLVDKTLHVGNIGDTLVVLSRKGEAELLSKRHDPTDREETARIRRAEAWVSTKGFVNDDKDIDVSRAFGFYHNIPAVNASPEIRTRQLAESDEFVIIGNHTLWKCCSYQTAVDIARTEKDDPMMAAQKLRDFAISYGADGSVMVMVVNISDLFFGRGGSRPRGMTNAPITDAAVEGDGYYAGSGKRVPRRREEVIDRTLNRLQKEIEPPTGQIAIVFTDIVNSTHLWETNPGMPTAIKMHHSLMRRQLRLDGGYEVKTEGDSFMVSFQSVTAALLWCFNCQIMLLTQEWPRELLEAQDGKVVYDSKGTLVQRGLRVRMGVHWGAPECERDPITRRMDYYGPMVNRAARINASADGGQLMASQDVIKEIGRVREYLETSDEDAMNDLPAELKREVMELRRIGVQVKDMGERKLKGLEVPEKLHLLYPKTLSGRLEISNDLRKEVEVTDMRKPSETRVIDIEQVRQLSSVCLRLEAICALRPSSSPSASSLSASPSSSASAPILSAPGVGPPGPITSSSTSTTKKSPGSNGPLVSEDVAVVLQHEQALAISSPLPLPVPPAHLGPTVNDEMTDDELLVVIDSLTGRIENALSTLYLKQLGGFSSVLAALEQATKIDPKLIVHAMSLMNGALPPSS